jgi:hypothetical protein
MKNKRFNWHNITLYISILITSNEIQLYAGVYLLQNYSTYFECPSYPSSGVHQIVTAASGTGFGVRASTFRQRYLIRTAVLIRPHWRKVDALTPRPVPEVAITVLCTPDDGCDGHPKHVE